VSDLALLTCRPLLRPDPADWYVTQVHREDSLVREALEARGLSVERVDWADPDFDFGSVRAALVRTTWDYFERYGEFSAWLERARTRTQLFNPADTLQWNADKHYLVDLERAGIAVVESLVFEKGSALDLPRLLAERGWREAVIKPAISGGARLTFLVDRQSAPGLQATVADCLRREAMIVQPFVDGIRTEGEISIVVIGGEPTHAVRKVAKAGDFRVQDDHGGTVHPHLASREEIAFAREAIARCDHEAHYARVDVARDAAGKLRLMELELIEPELFFRFHPPAAEKLAEVVARALA
jgi:glutathione synthase/RimK-type ligase-like ATP-grasp enzyme